MHEADDKLMRVVIVHNSGAGENQYDCDSLVRLIRRAGHEVAYFSSKDAAWKGAVDGFAEVVAVAGGDGTVEQVATAIAERHLPIAVLPLGTANNISRALGQANVAFEDLVASWADAWRQPFDIGLARGPWGTFRFLESVGAGLLAESMADIKEGRADDIRQAKDADGRMAAALGLFHRRLGRMVAMRFNLSLDGRDHSGDYLLLEVLTFGAAGPNLHLAPHAELSDGLLDVVLVDEHHRRDLADHLSLSRMDPVRTSTLPVYQGRHITLSCGRCHLHLDDEVWTGQRAGEDPIVIDLIVEPQAQTFLVPRASVRPNAR
jgi:diacylglycerol kinase (ATP)